MHPKTEFRVGTALVTQCHRMLKAVSPWASATRPASSMLLLALRLGFEVTLQVVCSLSIGRSRRLQRVKKFSETEPKNVRSLPGGFLLLNAAS
eukprot:2743071-Amphidinium_carterae.1